MSILTGNRFFIASVLLGTSVPYTTAAHAQAFSTQRSPKNYESASIRAEAGLRCKLYAEGAKVSDAVPVSTDSDGYARFYAVRAHEWSAVRRMTLDCQNEQGKAKSYAVDLGSDETFAPRPLDLSKEPGVDRPPLHGDPLSYSQRELLDRGYGLRPDPQKTPEVYQKWLAGATIRGRMLSAKRTDKIERGVWAGKASPWVGSVLTGTATYDLTYGYFNVPPLVPGGDGTSTTETMVWNGLGGYGTGSGLIQGGIYLYTNPSAAAYGTWREYCCGDPYSNGYGGAFTPSTGDQVFSEEYYCDASGNVNLNGGYGCTFLEDLNSGAILNCTQANGSPCWSVQALPTCSVSPGTPNCMTLGYAAEFILENVSSQVGPYTSFTDFSGTLTMSGWAHSTSGSWVTVNSDPSVTLLMSDYDPHTYLIPSLGAGNQTYFNVESTQPSYPLYCQGPLSLTYAPDTVSNWTLPATFFTWGTVGAYWQAPAPGHCTWYDRGGRGTEINSAGGNYLLGYLDQFTTMTQGEYAKFEVYRDTNYGNAMMVTNIDGQVWPPF